MELRTFIRTDLAASAIAHVTLVGLIILISEVHPFHAAPSETVSVDIVTPEEVKQQEAKAEEKAQEPDKPDAPEKPPEPPLDLRLPKLDVTEKAEPKQQAASKAGQEKASQQKSAPEPSQKQPSPQSPPSKQREANVQPSQQQPQQQPSPPQQPQPQFPPPPQAQPAPPASAALSEPQSAPPPAYQAPQPDVTVKYGVLLGLPPELPPEPKDAPKDDGGDAKDSIAAKLPPEVIAELRRRLRSCAKLPGGVSPTDNVNIKLRAVFATDGTLARAPILIEAPPSVKGVAIVKSAMSALESCQPYKMLPPNLYGEWKVMDLPFSPRDFGG